jgi:hypothetical protein
MLRLNAVRVISSATSHAQRVIGAELPCRPCEPLLALLDCESVAGPEAIAAASVGGCGPLLFLCQRRDAVVCCVATALRTTRFSPSIHSPGPFNCHTGQHAQHNGYLWPLVTWPVWERVIHEGFGRRACARTIPALFIPLASNQRQCASGKVVLAAQTLSSFSGR